MCHPFYTPKLIDLVILFKGQYDLFYPRKRFIQKQSQDRLYGKLIDKALSFHIKTVAIETNDHVYNTAKIVYGRFEPSHYQVRHVREVLETKNKR